MTEILLESSRMAVSSVNGNADTSSAWLLLELSRNPLCHLNTYFNAASNELNSSARAQQLSKNKAFLHLEQLTRYTMYKCNYAN